MPSDRRKMKKMLQIQSKTARSLLFYRVKILKTLRKLKKMKIHRKLKTKMIRKKLGKPWKTTQSRRKTLHSQANTCNLTMTLLTSSGESIV